MREKPFKKTIKKAVTSFKTIKFLKIKSKFHY